MSEPAIGLGSEAGLGAIGALLSRLPAGTLLTVGLTVRLAPHPGTADLLVRA